MSPQIALPSDLSAGYKSLWVREDKRNQEARKTRETTQRRLALIYFTIYHVCRANNVTLYT
jgi:hypothetical protein